MVKCVEFYSLGNWEWIELVKQDFLIISRFKPIRTTKWISLIGQVQETSKSYLFLDNKHDRVKSESEITFYIYEQFKQTNEIC